MTPAQRIGFMQGRLSPLVDGKIQAFPWGHWRDEFPAAAALSLPMMEWTLDHERLDENPFITAAGQAEIAGLAARHGLAIPSLTGDCFMQAPFWKAAADAAEPLIAEFDRVMAAAAALGVRIVVVPLVDNGRIETEAQADTLLAVLTARTNALAAAGLAVAFESDFDPAALARFIARLPAPVFGVNYDIGNSAALGFDPGEEIAAYADRILNVHVKDRRRGGTTVPLGTGAADLAATVRHLERAGYCGRYILQTARAADGDHAGALARYRDMTARWIAEATA